MKWDAERDSDRLDKKRDDEFAQECEFPDRGDTTQDGASTNVVVELTPSEARLSGDSDDDGEVIPPLAILVQLCCQRGRINTCAMSFGKREILRLISMG